MSITITPEWVYCSYPLIVEVYNQCSFNCLYCFTKHKESWHNKALKRKQRGFDPSKDIEKLDSFNKIFNGHNKLNKTERLLKNFIDKRIAIQIGAQTDPAGNYEIKFRQTKNLLELLKYKGDRYPIRISIKGIAFMDNQYYDIFNGYENASVLISLISTDDKLIRKIEPDAPSVKDRFALARLLSECGVKLGLRLRPIIPMFTEYTLEDLFVQAKHSGFEWVTVEWLRIPRTMTRATRARFLKLSEIVGLDLIEFFNKYSDINCNKNGFLRLKKENTFELFEKIISLGKKLDLKIASCNKDFRCQGTDTPNCCGIPLSDINWSRMQLSYAVYLAKENGRVFLSDIINYDSPLFYIVNKDNKPKTYNNLTYGESFTQIWNNPKHRFYPAKYFPELLFYGKDLAGNHIFSYKG
jgi:DNA repair photolyase